MDAHLRPQGRALLMQRVHTEGWQGGDAAGGGGSVMTDNRSACKSLAFRDPLAEKAIRHVGRAYRNAQPMAKDLQHYAASTAA